MSIRKRIKELKAQVAKMEEESATYWIGKWVKSLQINRIKRKIEELEKEMKPNHHPTH